MERPELDLLRRGYAAMGLGAPPDVLRLFDQHVGDDRAATGAGWCVELLESGGRYATRDVVAYDLFGAVPPSWDVTGVDLGDLLPYELADGSLRVVARGTYRCRPHGGWECYELPFAHVWTLRGGHVVRVVCYLEGIEVRRIAG